MIVKPKLDPQLHWFPEARFGMFVHFGIYALLGRGEWVQYREDIPREEYEKLTRRFNPKRFDADEWVRTARRAGCRYITVTAKHHDGFCLFDSKLTDYKITNTPFKRDLIGELIDACQRDGMRIILYYSQPDWHHPNYVHRKGIFKDLDYTRPEDDPDWPKFLDYYIGQVEELCTNYGRIDGFFFDGVQRTQKQWQGRRVYDLIRQHQPDAVVNDRAGYGDYFTPERSLSALPAAAGYMVEACQSVARGAWGFQKEPELYSSPYLLHSMIRMAAANGNYLLNVGPKPDGTLPDQWVQRLTDIGDWLQDHGKAIYDTQGCPLRDEAADRLYTRKDERVFLHLLQWPESDRIELRNLKQPPLRARMLKTNTKLQVAADGDATVISGLPASPPDASANVIELVFDSEQMFRALPKASPPEVIKLAKTKPRSLTPDTATTTGFGFKGSPLRIEGSGGSPAAAGVAGTQRVFSSSWQPEQKAAWMIAAPQQMPCSIAVEMACPKLYAGGTFVVDVAGEKLRGVVPATASDRDFVEVKLGTVNLPEGESKLTLSPVMLNIAYYFANVRQVILRPCKPTRPGIMAEM